MKKIIVTPAGRKRYLRILLPYLVYAKSQNIIDEWHLWINTANQNDIEYMKNLSEEYSFITCIKHPINPNSPFYSNATIHSFFPVDACDPGAIYLRLDDDICFADSDSIKLMFETRINNPEYSLISGNVINNSICSHLHQKYGALSKDYGVVGFDCLDDVGLLDPHFADYVHSVAHRIFNYNARKGFEKFAFGNYEMKQKNRISINAICWFGRDFAKFNGNVDSDEEHWLTVEYPKITGKNILIAGDAIFIHFAFHPQREFLETNTDWLEKYTQLSKKIWKLL